MNFDDTALIHDRKCFDRDTLAERLENLNCRVYEGGFQFKKHYFGPKPGELAEKTSTDLELERSKDMSREVSL